MSLRSRIAIALGALAAIAVTVASAGAYVATRDQLRESLDRALRVSTADIGRGSVWRSCVRWWTATAAPSR